MKAVFLTEPQKVDFREVPRPDPGPGQVRVRLKLVSICGSDVHLYKGDWEKRAPYPVRPGHEGIGYIDALGEGVFHLKLGQRIVIEPNFPCGHCHYCWRGQGNICPNKRIMGVNEPGCFAEYVTIPAQFAWSLPEQIADEDAVLIEPTAVGWHALQTATLRPGDTIAVIGLGAIGLLLAHVALKTGYSVVVYDRVPEKTAVAKRWGCSAIELDSEDQATEQLAGQLISADVSAIFECAGTAKTAAIAINAAPPGTQVVIVGLAHEPVSFIPFDITRRGLSILTSIIYNHPTDFSRIIELITQERIQPSKAISRQVQFEELKEALEIAANGTETKIVLKVA